MSAMRSHTHTQTLRDLMACYMCRQGLDHTCGLLDPNRPPSLVIMSASMLRSCGCELHQLA